MDHLDKLRSLVEPPKEPLDTQGDWDAVEKELRTPLPADYKKLIATYGTGLISDCDLGVMNPFSRVPALNLIRRVRSAEEPYQALHDGYPEDFPYPLWPRPGGIILWGNDGDGNDYFWLPAQEMQDWSIAASHHGTGKMYTWRQMTLTDFLVLLFTDGLKNSPFSAESFQPLVFTTPARPR